MRPQFGFLLAGALAVVLIALIPSDGAAAEAPDAPKHRSSIYDLKADGEKQLADALATAKREGKNVLLQFGANWCPDCHAMHRLFQTDGQIAAVLKAGYVSVMIDVDSREGPMRNAAVVARFGNPIEGGIPALVVLAADGAQLTPKGTRDLKDDDHRHPDKVLAFLKRWAPGAGKSSTSK